MTKSQSPLSVISEAASIALDEVEGWPCNLQDMTEREQQIAQTAEKLCGVMKFIQEYSEKHQPSVLIKDDIEFLIWCLGWIEGRISRTPHELPPDELVKVVKRCHDLWPKLSQLL